MLSDAISIPVSNEYELGSKVNQAVQNGQPDTFRMLLALLSEDICDQPQFAKLAPEATTPPPSLRQELQLAEPAPDYDIRNAAAKLVKTEAFHQGGIDDVRLLQCLAPEPLSGHASQPLLEREVQALLTPWQQHKLQQQPTNNIPSDWQQADQALLAVATAA